MAPGHNRIYSKFEWWFECAPLEMYMEHPLGSFIVANIPRRPVLVIRDRVIFTLGWPKMESCFHLLLSWRKILVYANKGCLTNYLSLFKAYIYPGVGLGNLDRLDFCTPLIEKTSKDRSSFKFSPHFLVDNPNDMVEVIMVFWKNWGGQVTTDSEFLCVCLSMMDGPSIFVTLILWVSVILSIVFICCYSFFKHTFGKYSSILSFG